VNRKEPRSGQRHAGWRRTPLVLAGIAVVALAATAGAASGGGSDDRDEDRPRTGPARNIILLIGDGMGVTHIDAARTRYYGTAGALNMERMPALGQVRTWAVEERSTKPDYVTDSASAGTAWSSGVKTYNNAIGKDAFGRDVPTIMEQARLRGSVRGT